MSPGVMAASGQRRNAAAIARWVIRDEGICPRLCAADIARYPPVREAPAYVHRTGEFALPPSGSVRALPRSACRIARRRGRRFHTPGNPGSSTYAPQIRGNLHASLGHRLHLVNTPTRGIHFYAQHRVGWACRKAEAAVNTLAHQIVGMRLTPQWPLARG